MIRQKFDLPKYDWRVWVYYAVDDYYADEILDKLRRIGCHGRDFRRAQDNLYSGRLDTGLTYSNREAGASVMVIALTSSPDEFQNSFSHEKGHLERHIVQAYGIDPFGEEAQYLAGEIGQKMFPVARKFLCECCRKDLKKLIK